MTSIFRNYVPPAPSKKGDVLKQQKPAVGSFPWVPNRNINHARMPHERGKFFSQKATGSAAVDSTPATAPSVVKLFPNNPVAVGTGYLIIMLDNQARTEFQVQNISTFHVFLGFGKPPTATSYDFVLAPCLANNDGTGGVYISDAYKGAVYAIADGAASISIKELP